MSAASLLSHQSAGSVLSHQSNGSVLSSQSDHALHGRRTRGQVPAGTVAAGVLTVLAAIALHRAHAALTSTPVRPSDGHRPGRQAWQRPCKRWLRAGDPGVVAGLDADHVSGG